MAMLAGASILWIFWTYGKGLPDYKQLANYEPPVVTRVHAGNGALLAEYASEKRLFVPVEAIPPRLIQAVEGNIKDEDFFCLPYLRPILVIMSKTCLDLLQ